MTTLPPCPQCGSTFTYEDGAMLIWVQGIQKLGAGNS